MMSLMPVIMIVFYPWKSGWFWSCQYVRGRLVLSVRDLKITSWLSWWLWYSKRCFHDDLITTILALLPLIYMVVLMTVTSLKTWIPVMFIMSLIQARPLWRQRRSQTYYGCYAHIFIFRFNYSGSDIKFLIGASLATGFTCYDYHVEKTTVKNSIFSDEEK